MIGVFICEERAEQRNRLTKLISNYILMEDLEMNLILSTPSPHQLIKYVEDNKVVDGLYFLDVNLATYINRIKLAVEIHMFNIFFININVKIFVKNQCKVVMINGLDCFIPYKQLTLSFWNIR